jgi:hypothetical protein
LAVITLIIAGDLETVLGLFKALTTISSSVKIANNSLRSVSVVCANEFFDVDNVRFNNKNMTKLRIMNILMSFEFGFNISGNVFSDLSFTDDLTC